MSFLVQPQRGYEHVEPQPITPLSVQDQNQSRLPPMPSSSTPPSPSYEYPSPQPPRSSQIQSSTPIVFDHNNSSPTLPKVGETRCYWSLLSSDLQFIYMDPVFTSHLEEQADGLVGKSLIAFIHPDDQTSAKHDLGSVLDSKTLHGSVTRVRFCRLSRVRRMLGYQGPGPMWSDADKIAIDANYMAVDIVLNWAAEGLVLCFLHAVVDLTPNDNDENNKTGWTNWCGTLGMTEDQVDIVYRRLLMCVPQPTSMSRVFQMISSQPGRDILISWPPDQGPGHSPTSKDFAKLAEDIQMGADRQQPTNATTSCTRRFKAMQTLPSTMAVVESVFIPHGTVLFACHKIYPYSRSSLTTTQASQILSHIRYASNTYESPSPHQQQYYESNSPYVIPANSPQYSNYPSSQQSQHHDAAHYSSSQWSPGSDASTSHQQQQQYRHSWNSPSPAHSNSSLPPAVSNLRSGSYPPSQPPPALNHQWPSQPSSYGESETVVSADSPTYGYSTADTSEPPQAQVNLTVPPPRRRVSPGNVRDQYATGARNAGNRPVGVLKCSSCKATQSPEWRKGPSGKKELCNACGLRYARSRAKKEGNNLATQRRRKDKTLTGGITKRDSATPPVSIANSGSPSYAPGTSSGRRGGYDDSSYSGGSVGGGDVYVHHANHRGLDTLTPSPSPPSPSMNFVHYSPHAQGQGQADGRQAYPSSGGGSRGGAAGAGGSSFYSVPSPLSGPSVHAQDGGGYGSERVSPMSAAESPLTSTVASASFERERDRDRELPPTPVSAEPRHQTRRSVMAHQRS